jgi:hypothetical protein
MTSPTLSDARLIRAREYLIGVPALTIKNPWPVAICHPVEAVAKRIENRPWPAPVSVSTVLIHAGAGYDPFGVQFLRLRAGIDPSTAVPSAIVAVADIAYCCDASRYTDTVVCGCGTWAAAGQYHWRLANVRVLPFPVPCKGAQKLWHPKPAVVDAVARQLAVIAGRTKSSTEKEPTNA